MKKVIILVLCIILSVLVFNASAQTEKGNEEYKQELMKYFKASGSDAAIGVSIEAVIAMMPNFDDAKKKEAFKTLMEKVMKEMMELMTPVYQKHISLADLKELNKFYETPLGKRLSTATGTIAKESIPVSQELAQKMQTIIQEFMMQ